MKMILISVAAFLYASPVMAQDQTKDLASKELVKVGMKIEREAAKLAKIVKNKKDIGQLNEKTDASMFKGIRFDLQNKVNEKASEKITEVQPADKVDDAADEKADKLAPLSASPFAFEGKLCRAAAKIEKAG